MASKHTPHSGAHGPARIDITKRNKKRRADKRAKVALKRSIKLDGRRLLVLATKIAAERVAITGIKTQDDSIASTA